MQAARLLQSPLEPDWDVSDRRMTANVHAIRQNPVCKGHLYDTYLAEVPTKNVVR